VSLNLAGAQHVANASAALSVAIELGVDPVLAAERLLAVRPSAGRGAVFKRSTGGRVVDDSYNANPAAVRAAVDVLAREPVFRVLILGPMLELGDTSPQLHAELGAYARHAGIDRLITVGEEASSATESFGPNASHFADLEALRADFPILPADHIVWVKGSRAAGLEHLVSWLLGAKEVPPC
jgi:UDP-N-acetylmuramoyl-tripeptide--D-alanyl-D-alanine ligase